MAFLPSVFSRPICKAEVEAKVGQLLCSLGGLGLVPIAVVALVRHAGNRSDFFVGLGMAFVLALLLIMLGVLTRHVTLLKIPAQARWVEFLSYLAGIGVMIGGIRALAAIGGSPAQITLGLLTVMSLSLAVLSFGMLTSVARTLRIRE